ncbi:Uncharacterized protein OBRU01_22709 [Operophtera brumata]|uniref:Uncharacterized protein n=1 Tax=Operophtera brumata TaxID=104452 RepID=A0A0L7KR63_OPEBR|nr:Uncharacterized protein OBRU01_22709 [Operophtera brumata]
MLNGITRHSRTTANFGQIKLAARKQLTACLHRSSNVKRNYPPLAYNGEFWSDKISSKEAAYSLSTSSNTIEPSSHQPQTNQIRNYEGDRVGKTISLGRRIVNISHFFRELQKISSHGPLDCGLESIEIISERLTGLTTKLTLKCHLCNMIFVIDGDNSPEEMNLNTCAVAGAIAAGCGHDQLQEITSTLGLPVLWPKLYNFHMNIVNKKWESELLKSMNEAAEQERSAAIEEGRVNAAGIPIIDVIADGCWAKRSYQKNYSSLSGAAAILGKHTNKILYMAVKNKFCCICVQAEKKEIPAKDHICYKNYTAKHKNTKNPMPLHNHIMLAADHAFGHHTMCKEYFCGKPGEAEDTDKDLYTNTLWQKIKLILSQLAAHSRSLLHDVDSNSVERYHSIVAKFVGGKRINFVQRYQYAMRCNAAALSFNTKKPLSLLHKSIVGRSPRGKIHKLEGGRTQRLEKNKIYKKIKKRIFENKCISSANYGEDCTKPDMSNEMMEEAKKLFLKNLEKNEYQRKQIERDTIFQSDSSEWLELRRNLLTSSNFGKIIKRRSNISCSNIVRDLIYKKPIDHVRSIKHGREKEAIAKQQLEKEKNIKIQACGLFLDEKIPFLGASPDGIIDSETICEIKCPISAYKIGLEKAITDKKVTFLKKTKNNSYNTIGITKSKANCILQKKTNVLFGEDIPITTEIIYKDDMFWETKMETKLITFYTDCILPELVDP